MAQALELAVNELWDFALAEQIALKFLNSKQDVLKHLLDLYLKHPEPELRVFFVASILDRFTSQFKVTEVIFNENRFPFNPCRSLKKFQNIGHWLAYPTILKRHY